MDFSKFDQIIETINEKIGLFQQAEALSDWSHRIVQGIESPGEELFAGESQVIQPPLTWSSAEGNAWFWKDISLPGEVNGISVSGSLVDFVFMLPIGAAVYLNGKQVYSEPFWSDTRAIELRLFESYQPGETMRLAIKAKSGDGFGLLLESRLSIERLMKASYELETFREQLRFCRYLLEKNLNSDPRMQQVLRDGVDLTDLEALRRNDWIQWRQSVSSVVDRLMPFNTAAKSYEVSLAAHSHIDMNWLWPWTETVEVCRRDFTSMDRLMDRFPDFHFSQSQVSAYKAMADCHPEVFERIRERVREGRWEVTASTWVEGDLNMALGETLVRQILHSKRYLRQNFGLEPRICWEPDTFGHPATYPQILKKSGIDYYYFCRAGKGHPVFWWEAPDGSRVQALNDLFGYGGDINPTMMVESCKPMFEHLGLKTALWIYGVGDHGGAATARDVQRVAGLDAAPLLPHAKMSGATSFHEKLEASGVEYPVVRDELNTVFEGCYTSHADIKRLNRYGETALLTAETMAAVSSLAAGTDYPAEALADAWKNQCFHQFHDILCGCSIGSTYDEAAETLKPSHESLRTVIAESTLRLAAAVDTGGRDRKIVVFNQLAWDRTDLVEIPVETLGRSAGDLSTSAVVDEAGLEAPVQVLDGKLVFVAKDVPSLGCKVYKLEVDETSAPTTLRTDPIGNTIENEFFKLHVNPNSGAIDSLFLKSMGREIAQPASGWGPEGKINAGMLNRFAIHFEQPHPMSAWNIGDITGTQSLIAGAEVRMVVRGPVCSAVEVKHTFLNSSLTQQIRVYSGLDRIDFITEVDWHERGGADHDAPMLKAAFTPYLGKSSAVYEIPFGAIERTADGSEVPALRWADLSDENCGLTLVNNCKYGHSAQGNTLALTLVRASYEPDNNPDEGLHQFVYSIVPHAGNWQDSGAVRRGAELGQPLIASAEPGHPGSIQPGESLLYCDSDRVVVSAVKFAEDQPETGKALIARLFESEAEPAEAVLQVKWPLAKAEEVNMLEEEGKPLAVEGNGVKLSFGPSEIKTIKLLVR